MAEILSQKEIDELLSALNSGEVDVLEIQDQAEENKIKEYDFKRPNKFAKDQLRTLQIIYESFARMMSSYLSGVLRTYCQAEVVSVEPLTYYEFNNSLPDPVILNIITFNPLKGSIMLAISPDMAFSMIDKMLGGPGTSINKVRNFTEIELVLIERIVKNLLRFMSDAWKNVVDAEFRLDKIETNAQFAQIMSPNEPIAIVTLNVQIGESEGMVNICIPHIVIEPISHQLTTKYWFKSQVSEETKNEEKAKVLSEQLKYAKVNLRAILGETSITVDDFANLQEGDVIRLDRKANEDIDIMIENLRKFKGIVGLQNNNLAIQITTIEERGL
mgnify:CR=1 FL=1